MFIDSPSIANIELSIFQGLEQKDADSDEEEGNAVIVYVASLYIGSLLLVFFVCSCLMRFWAQKVMVKFLCLYINMYIYKLCALVCDYL